MRNPNRRNPLNSSIDDSTLLGRWVRYRDRSDKWFVGLGHVLSKIVYKAFIQVNEGDMGKVRKKDIIYIYTQNITPSNTFLTRLHSVWMMPMLMVRIYKSNLDFVHHSCSYGTKL